MIVGLFTELLSVGGIQQAGRLTAVALNEIALRHGWNADFLSLNDSPSAHTLPSEKKSVAFRGFGRAKVPFTLAGLRTASKGARIVIAGHPNLAVPASCMGLLERDLKTIVLSHGVEVWSPLSWVRRQALLRADVVLAPSRYTATKLTEVQGVPAERVRTLAWPLSPNFLHLADTPAGHQLPQGFPQGRVVLTVGRWLASERYKGADELIQATSQLQSSIPDLHLAIVGRGDDLPRLKELAAGLGISNRVSFLQAHSREELAACYSQADVFALPSTGEGFGFVFLEAMAFGKPVVGAAAGGITDLVEDEINGLLVLPHDSERLGHALGRLLQDDSLRARLGRGGAEIVRQNYRFDVFQTKLEGILGECGLRKQTVA
jgi:glycosyltransferase involved in cell wall biosynthesis